jgi:hypothetical protein
MANTPIPNMTLNNMPLFVIVTRTRVTPASRNPVQDIGRLTSNLVLPVWENGI